MRTFCKKIATSTTEKMDDQISYSFKCVTFKNQWLVPQNTPLIITYRATTMATNIFECNIAAKMNPNLDKISFSSLTWKIILLQIQVGHLGHFQIFQALSIFVPYWWQESG